MGTIQNAANPFLKLRRFRQPVVQYIALVIVEGFVGRHAADMAAKKQIGDALRREGALNHPLVEVDGVTGVGARSDIDDGLDLVLFQQADECFEGVVRVPNGQDLAIGHGRFGFHRVRSCTA